ncbi:MAG: exodeoxyribonuclease VII small subunit [Candidatus Marinimicrobia bacterium]|nr:exodeoxyribonuclease VII small subunit [Candidatus Neomarinimicrobiota bacterium]MCH8304006.1 exodeoxyribonuclease VII small subunit [Candidatus Neomarinimicrobiota bacterium]
MSSDKNKSELTFEDALERLNEIVHKLEKGDKKLEDSIKLFEEGVKLSRFCKEVLKEAAEKVEGLKKEE